MKCNLSDICSFVNEKISLSELTKDTYISTENMLTNRGGITVANALPSIAQTQAFKAGDVLVSNIRPYFKKIWHATFNGGCSNDVLVFRAKESIDSDFLYYVLADDAFFNYATGTSKGTKMPRGDKSAIMQYGVPNIALSLQTRIAHILKPIDNKISLNNAINHNLEQQAHNIFKAKFINNPNLGSIEKIPLAQLCSVITKGTTPTTLGKQFIKNGINFIKAESILDNHTIDKSKFNFIDEETNILLKRSSIHSGDIVFTIAGPLGRFALVSENIIPANTNQAVAIIRADRSKILPEYLYSCFIGEWHIDYYSKRVQQAVQANLSLSTIKSLPIPLIKNNEMEDYLRIIQPIFETIKANNHQNETLLNLRNTLLPRLMSGEIDVSEVDI